MKRAARPERVREGRRPGRQATVSGASVDGASPGEQDLRRQHRCAAPENRQQPVDGFPDRAQWQTIPKHGQGVAGPNVAMGATITENA